MKKLILLLFACLTIASYGQNTGDVRISIWTGVAYNSGLWTGTGVPYISGSATPAVRTVSGTGSIVAVGGTFSGIVTSSTLGSVLDAGGFSIINLMSAGSPSTTSFNFDDGEIYSSADSVIDVSGQVFPIAWDHVAPYSTEQVIATGTAPSWDLNNGVNARFTATSAATFSISNLRNGQVGTLSITQASGTAGFAITFPAGTKQAFGGTNVYTMSGTNAVDILYFYRTGTNNVITGVVPGVTP